MNLRILTLTTDLGNKDYYVGKLKGTLLRYTAAMGLMLVDITHEVDSFSISHGAFILKNCFADFPQGTIHLLSVHNFYSEAQEPRFLLVYRAGHYFLGADNGQFSLLFDGELLTEVYELPALSHLAADTNASESLNRLFAEAVAGLLKNLPLSQIGSKTDRLLQRISPQAVIGKDYIRGSVAHIDKYENVILNVDRRLFERVGQGRSFELYYRRFDPITRLHRHYADVPVGDVLCFFNAADLLEIAIHLDKAAPLLGLHVEDLIQIDFFSEK